VHDVVEGGAEEGELLRRYADVLAVVHISRYYYLASKDGSSSSNSKSNGTAPAPPSVAVPMEALYDDNGKVGEAFGLLDPKHVGSPALECLFLVRPDGYIGLRAVGWGLRPVLAYMDALFPGRRRRQHGK
jgi:hypothetical protein